MVIARDKSRRRKVAALTTELMVGMGILVIALIPLSFSFFGEQKLLRSYYQRAVAMEIVDGEMEILLAGEWRKFGEGSSTYPVHAEAAGNLTSKRFVLTRSAQKLRLEWFASEKSLRPQVVREGVIP